MKNSVESVENAAEKKERRNIAAQQLGNGARYKEIKTLNGLKNNTIHAGQVLKLPN